MKKLFFILVLLTLCVQQGAAQDDVSKLVRIQEDDWWVYERGNEAFNYTVGDSFINGYNKEVNLVTSNATLPAAPFGGWVDGNFSLSFDYQEFNEYYSTRGNYWHGVSGNVTVTADFAGTVFEWNISGDIWVNNVHGGSQNMAIVSGEPQLEGLSLAYETSDMVLQVRVNYLIVPADPVIEQWKDVDTTVVELTETINSFEIWAGVYVGNGSFYHYDYDRSDGASVDGYSRTYKYSKDIGLPIEITTTGLVGSVSSVYRSKTMAMPWSLVDYSILESLLDSDTPGVGGFGVVTGIIGVLVLLYSRRSVKP